MRRQPRFLITFQIRYKTLNGAHLSTLSIPKGDWFYDPYYALLSVAIEWNIRPSEIGYCDPEDDIVVMMSYNMVKAKMQAFDAEVSRKDSERARRKAKLGGKK